MNRAEKVLKLYSMLLLSDKKISLTELSRHLECSKQTAERCIDDLEKFKLGKIQGDKRGRENIYWLERPRTLPKLVLDAEGLNQLALCRTFLIHLLPDSMKKNTEAVLRQASAYLPQGERLVDTESGSVSVAKGTIDYSGSQDRLTTLVKAIREKKVCDVRYCAVMHGEEKEYSFAPKKLIAYHEAFYVRGWIVSDKGKARAEHDKPTNLAVHRLGNVAFTCRDASHLPEPDNGEGKFGFIVGEPFRTIIRFSSSAAMYAVERRWSADQKLTHHRDGRVSLTMTAQSSEEVIAWVLSFGESAELLSPRWLREEMAKRVTAMATLYRLTHENNDREI